MNDWDFGDPVGVPRTKKEKFQDWLKENRSWFFPTVGTGIVIIIALLTLFVLIQPPNEQTFEETFDTEIKGMLVERIDVDLENYFFPRDMTANLEIEGVVPHPGWVRVFIENFTHHEKFDQPMIKLEKITTVKKFEFSVDRGNFKEQLQIPMHLDWRVDFEYPPQNSNTITHGPIGNIVFRAEYYDSEKEASEIFFIKPFVTGSYVSD